MDLKDLKKTWDKLASGKELDESEIREMLGKRTKNHIERIDRNIRLGFVVLSLLILVFILDDFLFSPLLMAGISENLSVPNWLLFLGVFSDALILFTFIYFVIKYFRVKRSCDISCNLKETLVKIINTLKIYQRMFYLALIFISITMITGFISGMYQGTLADLESQGIAFSEISIRQLLVVIVIGLLFLLITVGGIFIFLRWGFRRLYGNYIAKLKLTLKELEEINE
ncbi:MAG: hypothetical protein JW761_06160 [Prolixibacteraceae bacterium]|nr:hypothetical protein [Prolixibacteraceae bacterium]